MSDRVPVPKGLSNGPPSRSASDYKTPNASSSQSDWRHVLIFTVCDESFALPSGCWHDDLF